MPHSSFLRFIKQAVACVLVVTILAGFTIPSSAQERVYGETPLYIGYPAPDYMAEQILKNIKLAGKSDTEKIRTIYDWVILNHTRIQQGFQHSFALENDITEIPDQTFYEQTAEQLKNGEIMLRKYQACRYQNDPDLFKLYMLFDSNSSVADYAHEMMLDPVGYCEHFASILALLLGHAGYDCRVISGKFLNSDGSQVAHAWNYVLVGGKYYWMDVRIDHATYTRTGNLAHDYFMVADTSVWVRSHSWNREYTDLLASHAQAIAAGYATSTRESAARFSQWADSYIRRAGQQKLLPYRLETADYTKPITRKDFAAIAVQMYAELSGEQIEHPTVDHGLFQACFWDCDDPDVIVAYKLGLINGVGDGLYAPNSTLTREQAVTILGRICELIETGNTGTGKTLQKGAKPVEFQDWNMVGSWAAPYVSYFVSHGIVDGVGNQKFAPTNTMTREQAIKIVVETLRLIH